MTPLQFAQAECANYEKNGSCAGIGIKDDGSLYMFGRKPFCELARRKPCRYFEECVLPMGIDTTSAVGIGKAKEREEALRLYAVTAPKLARNSGRLCPMCRQRELEPCKQLCYECRNRSRKSAYRRYTQKRGLSTTEVQKNHTNSLGK